MLAGPNTGRHRLILASASHSRQRMLADAGVAVEAVPAGVDEDEVKAALRAEQAPPDQIADTLAELKAQRVSSRNPGAFVLGADQVLALENTIYDKPVNMTGARDHLMALRGRTHRLFTSAVVVRDAARIWGATEQATLQMRALPDETIDRYLDQVGEAALTSVGAYQLEGLGAQLFSRIEGDFFTILGLPLLPLLGFLRENGLVAP